MRLLLDEMYPPVLAEKLRAQGHDVLAVTENPDLVGSDDETVLAHATAAQRCLVSENVQDFAALAKHCPSWDPARPSTSLVPGRSRHCQTRKRFGADNARELPPRCRRNSLAHLRSRNPRAPVPPISW